MPRNPSELQRLEEERIEILEMILRRKGIPASNPVADKGYKSARQVLITKLRKIEKQLGIDGFNYNSEEFSKQLD